MLLNQCPQLQSIGHEEEHGVFPENNQVVINFCPREPNTRKRHGQMVADTSFGCAVVLKFDGWSQALLFFPRRRYWSLNLLAVG